MPTNGDEAQRKAFKIELENMMNDSKNEIWFGDESGIEGDPRTRKRWVKKGEKYTIPHHGKHIRVNVIGAVCPDLGEVSTVVFDYCDTISFQAFLNTLSKQTEQRAKDKMKTCKIRGKLLKNGITIRLGKVQIRLCSEGLSTQYTGNLCCSGKRLAIYRRLLPYPHLSAS
jgi:hypothetical protein